MADFERVKSYLAELGLPIAKEEPEEQLVIVNDESQGIKNLIVDCEAPILVLEQFIFPLKDKQDPNVLMRLLQMNRELVHGAFVVDDSSERVLFRDTLQLENLDLNEFEGSIKALSLAMAENAEELIAFAAASKKEI